MFRLLRVCIIRIGDGTESNPARVSEMPKLAIGPLHPLFVTRDSSFERNDFLVMEFSKN
jgi:hypothetical protein